MSYITCNKDQGYAASQSMSKPLLPKLQQLLHQNETFKSCHAIELIEKNEFLTSIFHIFLSIAIVTA